MSEQQNKPRWMKIHSGLNEAKHRETLGIRIWLFMYMIDCVDWTTGIIDHWTDAKAADVLEMPASTLKAQRQQLHKDGYITCYPTFQAQRIVIHKWRDPRNVEAIQINVRTEWGGSETGPDGETNGPSSNKTTPPSGQESDPPSIDSHSNHISPPNGDTPSSKTETHPDWGDMFVAVKDGWGMQGSRPGVIVKQLIGCSDGAPETDIDPPATLDEIRRFPGWYQTENEGGVLPTKPLVLEDWFYRFRENGAGAVPVPEFD